MVSVQTRDRILDVALELIADNGFAATSTRELSERLGFTKAALYYHFSSKEDLLAALVAPVLADLGALLEGEELPMSTTQRRDLLGGYVDFVATHEAVIRVLSHDPSIKRQLKLGSHLTLYARLLTLLVGHDAPDTVERTRVRVALGGIHAALLRPSPDDDPDVVRDAAVRAACGALGIRGPR